MFVLSQATKFVVIWYSNNKETKTEGKVTDKQAVESYNVGHRGICRTTTRLLSSHLDGKDRFLGGCETQLRQVERCQGGKEQCSQQQQCIWETTSGSAGLNLAGRLLKEVQGAGGLGRALTLRP